MPYGRFVCSVSHHNTFRILFFPEHDTYKIASFGGTQIFFRSVTSLVGSQHFAFTGNFCLVRKVFSKSKRLGRWNLQFLVYECDYCCLVRLTDSVGCPFDHRSNYLLLSSVMCFFFAIAHPVNTLYHNTMISGKPAVLTVTNSALTVLMISVARVQSHSYGELHPASESPWCWRPSEYNDARCRVPARSAGKVRGLSLDFDGYNQIYRLSQVPTVARWCEERYRE